MDARCSFPSACTAALGSKHPDPKIKLLDGLTSRLTRCLDGGEQGCRWAPQRSSYTPLGQRSGPANESLHCCASVSTTSCRPLLVPPPRSGHGSQQRERGPPPTRPPFHPPTTTSPSTLQVGSGCAYPDSSNVTNLQGPRWQRASAHFEVFQSLDGLLF